MSGLFQYQNTFRIAKPDATSKGTQPRPTKWNRRPVSCAACRTRKLKCDRQMPCMPCSKRGDPVSCIYSNSSKNGHKGHDEGSRKSEAQLRLQSLEEMVTSLMQTSTDSSESRPEKITPPSATIDQRLKELSVQSSKLASKTSSRGHLDVNGSETYYLGDTHWETILENIRDIQDLLEPEKNGGEEQALPSSISDSPDIVLDTTQSLTLADVCNSLPPRPVVDTILSVYFNSKYHQTPIIHNRKFLREYESFWVDPSSVSFLWISILFSLLWMGSQYSQRRDQEISDPRGGPARPDFFTKAGEALVAGKYRRARPYSVEAVLLYANCTLIQREDADVNAWMIMGVSTRLAMKMGYHRDPCHLASISPFEGEMRRRTFFIVQTFDSLLSFQAGLPAIIHEEECDTDSPSNLFDEDFDEECKILPPSRPPTDPTPMLYYCSKGRFATIFRRVIRHALSLKTPSYQDTMKLDGELHEMHADVPPSLRMRPLSSSFSDQAHTIMERLNLEVLYLSCVCILHRTYISHDRSNPTFAYSRKTCAEAALKMLRHHAELYAACQPGGRFFHDRWMLSNLSMHDFLLAAMITCLDLYEFHNHSPSKFPEELKAQAQKYDALRLSHEIWTSRREFSRDARRASNILSVMLLKVPRPNIAGTPGNAPLELSDAPRTSMNEEDLAGSGADSSESSLWNTSAFDAPGQEFDLDNSAALDFTAIDPLNTVFDESDIDWGLVDQYLFACNNVYPL